MGTNTLLTCVIVFGLILNVICEDNKGHFTDTWAVTIPGGLEKAQDIIRSYGFAYVDTVSNASCP